MSSAPYPVRIQSVHVELIGDELCIYDTARQRVHSLNHTAAFVWQRCDGQTAPAELAAALSAELAIDDAEAVVLLALQELAAAHLLAAPLDEVAPVSRRDLLRRGVAAAAIPAILSIVAPTPAAAQSPPPLGAPTLTGLSPTSGAAGTTVAVTLTGTNFVVGATTVTVNSGGVTATNVIVASTASLTANIVMELAAVLGTHSVSVTTAGGTSGTQTFIVGPPPAPTLASVSPNQGLRGATVAVTLTGTNFVVGGTTVAVAGDGVTVNNVVVGSSTSLTANFVLDLAALGGARTVTVTTAGGTGGGQTFTVTLPPPGAQVFSPTGGPVSFTVPAGVVSILIECIGARGGVSLPNGNAGNGGRAVARVSVAPGTVLTVRVGGMGPPGGAVPIAAGGFNGGGGSTGDGAGGGGGATSVHDGATPLVIAGGGGGAGSQAPFSGGNGGDGGGLTASPGQFVIPGGGPGFGGTQVAGGAGGTGGGSVNATDGTAGAANLGGTGGHDETAFQGGGGGGGGYFGGGGGGGGFPGGGGGGGGSSFTAPGATNVIHQPGIGTTGQAIISW